MSFNKKYTGQKAYAFGPAVKEGDSVRIRKTPSTTEDNVLFLAPYKSYIGEHTGQFQNVGPDLSWYEVSTAKGKGWVRSDVHRTLATGVTPPVQQPEVSTVQAAIDKLTRSDYKTYHMLVALKQLLAIARAKGQDVTSQEKQIAAIEQRYKARQQKLRDLETQGLFTRFRNGATQGFVDAWNSLTSLRGLGLAPLVIPVVVALVGGAAAVGGLWYWVSREHPEQQAFADSEAAKKLYEDLNKYLTPEQLEQVKPGNQPVRYRVRHQPARCR